MLANQGLQLIRKVFVAEVTDEILGFAQKNTRNVGYQGF